VDAQPTYSGGRLFEFCTVVERRIFREGDGLYIPPGVLPSIVRCGLISISSIGFKKYFDNYFAV